MIAIPATIAKADTASHTYYQFIFAFSGPRPAFHKMRKTEKTRRAPK